MVAAGRDCGFAQNYPASDAVSVDYAIGIEELTGCGLGPQLIWSYLRDIVLPAHPAATQAMASPDAANRRSIRALEKAGFRRLPQIDVDREAARRQVCVLDLARFFGERGRY